MPRPRATLYDGYVLIQGGASTGNHQAPAESGRLVATLWVPNPEYRSGFNEWNIYADAEPTTSRPPVGYRR
jgi:hypothetical protein